jgi:hypothetical protein
VIDESFAKTGGKEPKPTPKPEKKPIIPIPNFPITGGMITTSMIVLAGIWIITIAVRIYKPKKADEE